MLGINHFYNSLFVSISKFKKPYKLILSPFIYEKQIKDVPFNYTNIFLKPFQEKVPVNSRIEIPVNEVDLTFKRDSVLVYSVTSIDHQKKEIYANLTGLKKKEYHGMSKYPSNNKLINVTTKINGIKLVYTILYKQLLRSTELKELKTAVTNCLEQELTQFRSSLHKIATKELHEKLSKIVGSEHSYFKGVIVESFNC